ncbi:MAG: hypothetical protein HY833_01745 [Candidatus Aenigmarchaeota archaeon]|nr:hypothetical protein [Candidatus Aenigmarchaeota archaeon]
MKFKIKGLDKRVKLLFGKKTTLGLATLAVLTKSFPLVWLVGDALLSIKLYQKQNQEEHALRWARLGIGVTWFAGVLNPLVAGFLIFIDGAWSIFRYRQLHITQDFIEDVPRMARMGVGLIMMAALPITLPALGLF